MSFPKGYSFQVAVDRELDAIRFFYRFMTCGQLKATECTAFPSGGTSLGLLSQQPSQQNVTTLTEDDIFSERIFKAQMTSLAPGAIHSVGAFDMYDTKRVSAYYMSGSYTVKVVFSPNWRPTEEEGRIIESLFDGLRSN